MTFGLSARSFSKNVVVCSVKFTGTFDATEGLACAFGVFGTSRNWTDFQTSGATGQNVGKLLESFQKKSTAEGMRARARQSFRRESYLRILQSGKVEPEKGSTSSSILNKSISFKGCDIGDAGVNSVGSALEDGLNITCPIFVQIASRQQVVRDLQDD